jgi:DNA-directed RNA polymerase alpha subunit
MVVANPRTARKPVRSPRADCDDRARLSIRACMAHTQSTNDARAPVSPSARLDELGLPARAVNRLRHEGITCIGDVAQRTEDWILRTPGLGHKSSASDRQIEIE